MDYRKRIYDSYHSVHWRHVKGADADPRAHWPEYESWWGPHLPAEKGAAIVEVACGTGGFLAFLHDRGYGQARGVDASAEQVAAAKARGVARVEQAAGRDFLAANPGTFDRVFMMDFFEHIPKEEVLPWLDAALAALKPGGLFCLSTVNGQGLTMGRTLFADLTHEWAWTEQSLAQVLRAAGFEDPRFYPSYPVTLWTGLRGLQRRLTFKAFEAAARLFLDAGSGSGLLRAGHIWTDGINAVARRPSK